MNFVQNISYFFDIYSYALLSVHLRAQMKNSQIEIVKTLIVSLIRKLDDNKTFLTSSLYSSVCHSFSIFNLLLVVMIHFIIILTYTNCFTAS